MLWPLTLPGMSELPLQQSFKDNSGLHFLPSLKTSRYSLCSLVVSGSLWIPSWFSARFYSRSFNQDSSISHPTARQVLLISSDLSLHTFLSQHKEGWPPKPRLLGEHVGKTWPGATRAGHSHLWRQQLWLQEGAQLTQTSCCVPMATKVSCSSPSHFWKKKDIGLMKKNSKSPNGLCWAWEDF